MLLRLSLVAGSLALVQALSDGRPHANFMRKPTIPIVPIEHTAPVTSRNGTVLPPYNTTYTFQQLIDHNNVFFFPAPRRGNSSHAKALFRNVYSEVLAHV
jgi:hypothetical protein